MNTDKQNQNKAEEESREQQRPKVPDAGKQPNPLKKNPNPRANENLPDQEGEQRPADTTGVGSEITDGEDG
jgi:hypothetical protein